MTAPAALLGYPSGSRLDALTALKLAALPSYSPAWAIVPGPSGRGLNLIHRAALTAAQVNAAQNWAEKNARRIAKHAPPVLTAASVSGAALNLEALDAQGEALGLTISGPHHLTLDGETLSVWTGTGSAAQVLAVYALSPEGAASLENLPPAQRPTAPSPLEVLENV